MHVGPYQGATQNSLHNPLDVAFDSHLHLWVADWGNNRVLEYKPPFSDGMDASLVIGQNSFTTNTKTISQNSPSTPNGIAFSFDIGIPPPYEPLLWVSDYGDSRVLEFRPRHPPHI